jgi:hypothetical protein
MAKLIDEKELSVIGIYYPERITRHVSGGAQG